MCSRIFWNKHRLAFVVARTMDWPESTEPVLMVLPRGLSHDGGKLQGVEIVKENPLRWTSIHGSLVATIYGLGTADGINERGFAAHMLYLGETDFGPRDPSKPGLQAALWAQYLLDCAATVQEAIDLLANVQLVMVSARGHSATVHLSIEDATGDSAIIEFVGGKQTVHHSREYRIHTNDPTYAEQIQLLSEIDFSNPSDSTPVPGNVNPVDRFQRAAYFLSLLPEPTSEREAVAGAIAIARNVSIPFGAPYEGFGTYCTEYRTVCDVTNLRYFFELSTNPSVIWADLAKLDFSLGAPIKYLDPSKDFYMSGDISNRFEPSSSLPF